MERVLWFSEGRTGRNYCLFHQKERYFPNRQDNHGWNHVESPFRQIDGQEFRSWRANLSANCGYPLDRTFHKLLATVDGM